MRVNTFWMSDDKKIPDYYLKLLKTYALHGYEVVVWQYDDNEVNTDIVNTGFVFSDAHDILDRSILDEFRQYEQYKGIHFYRTLSDFVRYSLLYKLGGWYVDTDTLMLKSLDFDKNFVFTQYGRTYYGGMLQTVPGTYDTFVLYSRAANEEFFKSVFDDLMEVLPNIVKPIEAIRPFQNMVDVCGIDGYVPFRYLNPLVASQVDYANYTWLEDARILHASGFKDKLLNKNSFLDRVLGLVDRDIAPTYDNVFEENQRLVG